MAAGDGAPTKRPVPSTKVALPTGRSARRDAAVVRVRLCAESLRISGAGCHVLTAGESSIVWHADVVSAMMKISALRWTKQCRDLPRNANAPLATD